MPITFACPCGQQLQVDAEYAGSQAQCPTCSVILEVPQVVPKSVVPRVAPSPRKRYEETDDDVAATTDSLNSFSKRKRKRDDDDAELDEAAPPRKKRRVLLDDDEDEDDRPKKRRRRALDDDDDDDFRPRRKIKKNQHVYNPFNGQTIGGCVCLLICAIFVVIGIFTDTYFIWPIVVLPIIGLVSIVRGLVTGRDE